MSNFWFRRFLLPALGGLACVAAICTVAFAAEKMKPKELVGRHLLSLGSPEARAAAKNRRLGGVVSVTFRLGGTGRLDGTADFLSEGEKARLAMVFGHPEYPEERFVYDGDKTHVGLIRPSVRSRLSQFVYDNNGILSEGLMGGAISVGWCLQDLPGRNATVEYRGLKEVEGRKLHELRYRPRKGLLDFRVFLYFEPETFRHVFTEYGLRVPHFMATTPADSSKMRESYWKMTEQFDDFRTIDGLTLPHSYRLVLNYEGEKGPFLAIWEAKFDQVAHNSQLNPDSFVFVDGQAPSAPGQNRK